MTENYQGFKFPEAVVVDTYDGYVFHNDSQGHLFTAETAQKFADSRNAGLKPQFKTYHVFTLTPGTPASSPGQQLLAKASAPVLKFPSAPAITEPYGYGKAA